MYTDSINQFNGMSVVSGLSNVCICGDAIGDPKEIIIPNGFNPLTDNYIAIKAVFLNGHNAVNDSTNLTVKCKYSNGDYVQDGADVVQIPIMANKDGTLINIPIHTMDVSGTTTYKVLQPNTVLEMYYDPNANGGNGAFVVIGNPIVLSANDSNSSYTVYANGLIKDMGYSTEETWTGKYWIDGKKIYKKAGFFSGSIGGTSETVLDATLTLSYVDKLICGFSNGLNSVGNRIFIGGNFASPDVGRLSLNVTSSGLIYMTSAEARKDINWWVEYTKN